MLIPASCTPVPVPFIQFIVSIPSLSCPFIPTIFFSNNLPPIAALRWRHNNFSPPSRRGLYTLWEMFWLCVLSVGGPPKNFHCLHGNPPLLPLPPLPLLGAWMWAQGLCEQEARKGPARVFLCSDGWLGDWSPHLHKKGENRGPIHSVCQGGLRDKLHSLQVALFPSQSLFSSLSLPFSLLLKLFLIRPPFFGPL